MVISKHVMPSGEEDSSYAYCTLYSTVRYTSNVDLMTTESLSSDQ